MTYSVSYKKVNSLFWHKISNVTGDTIMRDDAPQVGSNQPFNVRVLFLADKSRIEIPLNCIIKFSPGRFWSIKENMEQRAGQKIPVKK